MKNVARCAASALAIILTLGWTATVSAATVTYEYAGSVQSCFETPPCSTSLSPGNDVTGEIVVDMDAVVPNGGFGPGNILDFVFEFGGITIDSGNSAFSAGSVGLDGAGNIMGGTLILQAAPSGLPAWQINLNLGSSIWAIFDVSGDPAVIVAGGSGKFGPGIVPIPAGLLLFGPALFAFGLLRRRT